MKKIRKIRILDLCMTIADTDFVSCTVKDCAILYSIRTVAALH